MTRLIKFTLLAFLLCTPISLFAQQKQFSLELGLNHPINFENRNISNDAAGLYLQSHWKSNKHPLVFNLLLAYNQYTVAKKDVFVIPNSTGGTAIYFDRYFKSGALRLIPSLRYEILHRDKFDLYGEIGVGVSHTEIEDGLFNSDARYYMSTMPRVGAILFNHFNVSLEYYLFNKDLNRGTISIGYLF